MEGKKFEDTNLALKFLLTLRLRKAQDTAARIRAETTGSPHRVHTEHLTQGAEDADEKDSPRNPAVLHEPDRKFNTAFSERYSALLRPMTLIASSVRGTEGLQQH